MKRTRLDNQIRQEAADHTATRAVTTQQLRDAVEWRDVSQESGCESGVGS